MRIKLNLLHFLLAVTVYNVWVNSTLLAKWCIRGATYAFAQTTIVAQFPSFNCFRCRYYCNKLVGHYRDYMHKCFKWNNLPRKWVCVTNRLQISLKNIISSPIWFNWRKQWGWIANHLRRNAINSLFIYFSFVWTEHYRRKEMKENLKEITFHSICAHICNAIFFFVHAAL